jgi:hypothetical protein
MVEMYNFALSATYSKNVVTDNKFATRVSPQLILRPTMLCTNVTEKDQIAILQIYINGDPQLIGALDAYDISSTLDLAMRAEFLKEHGLEGASHDEIDDYLDENELDIPSPCRTFGRNMPTLVKDRPVEIVGKWLSAPKDFCFVIMFVGAALVAPQ